jgi:hypothetical protein
MSGNQEKHSSLLGPFVSYEEKKGIVKFALGQYSLHLNPFWRKKMKK